MNTRASYYREQAKLLAKLAVLTRDRDYAGQLEARLRIYLASADLPTNSPTDLNPLLEEFNHKQLRGHTAGISRPCGS